MKIMLKEMVPPEEMFTVIHQERNVATDCADHLKNQNQNQNQKAEPAGSGANAQCRRNLHAAATFFFFFFSCRFGCIFLGGVV